MKTVNTIHDLRAVITAWRQQGEQIVFVPTMGNLHAGHLQLVDMARQLGTRVVSSIFVNPLQFVPGTDYENYPRTLKQDSEQLQAHGVALLFAPSVDEMYGQAAQSVTRVSVAGLSDILCGEFRPGHFAGVTTVVAKLFNLVEPQLAVFGEKDYQQLLVVRRLVADLCMAVEIIGEPTVREGDGLAMSSRNGYLSAAERAQAPALYQTLRWLGERLVSGMNYDSLAAEGMNILRESGFEPDYVAIRRAEDLQPPQAADSRLIIMAAAWMGKTRLIDNLAVTLKDRL